MTDNAKPKLLIFIVCYNAERFIKKVVDRIPIGALQELNLDVEILIIDDKSPDSTFYTAKHLSLDICKVNVLQNPNNMGYGGNQKIGYQYAIRHNFDYVVLLHGDGQYAPKKLPDIARELLTNNYGAVYGSRMTDNNQALKGGMPLYKYWGNKLLTYLQNKIVGTSLSEYHSGYRSYSVQALKSIPFCYNSNDFDFDTDIIIQLHLFGYKIKEIPIPTFYGEEECHVNGVKYAFNILKTSIIARCQRFGLLYDQRFDTDVNPFQYASKTHYCSTHTGILSKVNDNDDVLYLGPNIPELITALNAKVGSLSVFCFDELRAKGLFLDDGNYNEIFQASTQRYSKIIALDLLQRAFSPEMFLQKIKSIPTKQNCEFIFVVPNIGFFIPRLMLLFGFFHYGKQGILDREHHRLFTKSSILKILTQEGYKVIGLCGYPAPFPLALPNNPNLARWLLNINRALVRLFPGLFSFQLICAATVSPTLDLLLDSTLEHSAGSVS